ncbi:nucleotidyltransferase family protein [Synechococcus sp. CBW1108]|uniref:nucleotidyltransferase family protein n=1 Tax=Synechococcus sp. CBW1108 TaxID=1353147 RepID=UPI0018CCDC9A|nr:nucleotidyltransferase domain-containing protein [Synechococcus sp. CBW1108]QPN71309.1 nucleotidyltransferase domain-containing protein [Synechococcus sp. CBW1108]
MVASAAERFTPPPIPWRHPLALEPAPELGPGLDPQRSGEALARLCAEPDVQAVIAFGSRARGEARPDSDLDLAVIVGQPQLTPTEKMACWKRFNRALGRQGVAVDLVVAGSADAERLSGSRWHVFGDVAREGRVLYVAR